ncbi:MAG: DNA polymerase III subunit gamma/tau [Muribaculaceae bacterium]|nr:DNA polymerase III subunit gamma/tau [Muribaculaceae bacterium]
MDETYIVSARKYRPATFSSVVGQGALTATLRNAISTRRLAHAYLFTGSRGVGKTSCARIFAKTINCEHPTAQGDPCNECESCRLFNENRSLNIMELDAASNNGVDAIRELADQVRIPPTSGRYRVFIIDEVHMLSPSAFNAFLKTLEEPPEYVIFILATTEKHKIIPTILSRCQIYDFKRITVNDIVDHLAYVASSEGIEAERSALSVIAQKADGAMRDALSIFDQVAASSRGHVTYQTTIDNLNVLDERYFSALVEAFREGDVAKALTIYKTVRDNGFDSHFFITGLAQYMRDLMLARNPQTIGLLDTDDAVRDTMARQGAELQPEFFYDAMSLCNEADLNYREASSKTFLVELLLIRLCQLNGPSPGYSGGGEGRKMEKITVAAPAAAGVAPVQPAPRPATPSTPTTAPGAPRPPKAPAPPAPASVPPAPRIPASGRPPVPGAPRGGAAVAAGRGHVSLSQAFAAPQGPAEERVSVVERNNRTPFTSDQLLALWDKYMAQNPKAHLLVNTMRLHTPVSAGDAQHPELYVVTVLNPSQKEELEQEKGKLLPLFRRELKNDFIDLQVNIDTTQDTPTAWSDRRVLEHLESEYPNVGKLIRELKLTIS